MQSQSLQWCDQEKKERTSTSGPLHKYHRKILNSGNQCLKKKDNKVGFCLLATGAGFCTLRNLFGIAKFSVSMIIHLFYKAMHHFFMPDYIKLPKRDDTEGT